MSWSTVNEILGLAIVDPTFRRELLSSPLKAVEEQGFVLTLEEICVIQRIHARDLTDFSQHIIDNLYPKQ
jgi:hypothetical protein